MDNSGRKDHLSVHSWIWGLRGTHGTAAAQLQLQQGPAELRGRFQPAGGRSRPTRPRCPGPGTADLRAPPSSGPAQPCGTAALRPPGQLPGRPPSPHQHTRGCETGQTHGPPRSQPPPHRTLRRCPAGPLLSYQSSQEDALRTDAGVQPGRGQPRVSPLPGGTAALPWRSWARPGRGSAGAAPHTRGRAGAAAATPPRDAPRTKMAAPSASVRALPFTKMAAPHASL